MNTYLGVSALLGPDDVERGPGRRGQGHLLRGLPLGRARRPRPPCVKAMDHARQVGTPVAFTPVRLVLRRPPPRRVPRPGRRSRRHPLRQRGRDLLALRGRRLRGGRSPAWPGTCGIACLTRSEQGSVIITSDGARVETAAAGRPMSSTPPGPATSTPPASSRDGRPEPTWSSRARVASLVAAEVISHIGARPEADLRALTGT